MLTELLNLGSYVSTSACVSTGTLRTKKSELLNHAHAQETDDNGHHARVECAL